jgi:iron(III) transport system permease protein
MGAEARLVLAGPARTWRRPTLWHYMSLVILVLFGLFLIYPLWGVLRNAVYGDSGTLSAMYFVKFFANPYYFGTILNSLAVSAAATLASLVVGIPFSYFYTYYSLRGARVLFIGAVLSVMSAPFIGAYAWILLLGRNGLITNFIQSIVPIDVPSIYGFGGIVLVLTLKMFPLISIFMNAAFRNIDSSILEAAALMGSTGVKRVVDVMLRLTVPTLLAASLLVFMRAFADFGTPLLIGRGYRTFTVELYNQYLGEIGQNHNFAAAIGIVGLVVTGVLFLFQKYVAGKFRFTLRASRPIPKKKPRGIGGALIYAYMYGLITLAMLPQLYVLYLSFRNNSQTIFKPGFSLGSYHDAWDHLLVRATINTLEYAAISMVIIIAISVVLAYLVVRRPNVLNNTLDTVAMIPYILPGAVIAIGLVIAFNGPPLAISGTAAILIVAYVVRRMPYTIRSASATLMQIPRSLEEAARSLGSSRLQSFIRVTLPMMSRGIRSGAVISFVMVIIEFSAGIILYNNRTITLTMAAYVAISRGSYGMAAAFASILSVLTAIVLLVYLAVTKEEEVAV